jgi:hypothetical protein
VSVDSPPPHGLFAGYDDAHHPLISYALLTAAFQAGLGGSIARAARSQTGLPERIGATDIALLEVATHRLSRLITKDRVTSFMRAPFTRYQESAGPSEVSEQARGVGAQRAIGELLVCPYCVGQWVAGGMFIGLVRAPRVTRLIAAIYASLTISDLLQLGYQAAQEQT